MFHGEHDNIHEYVHDFHAQIDEHGNDMILDIDNYVMKDLIEFSKKNNRDPKEVASQAIEIYIENARDYNTAQKRLKTDTISMGDLMKEFGMDY